MNRLVAGALALTTAVALGGCGNSKPEWDGTYNRLIKDRIDYEIVLNFVSRDYGSCLAAAGYETSPDALMYRTSSKILSDVTSGTYHVTVLPKDVEDKDATDGETEITLVFTPRGEGEPSITMNPPVPGCPS